MSKNVYSLVLTDEIVSEIDRLAYKNGTNRSGMINRILAEYISYTTPEMRIGKVFEHIGSLLGDTDNFKMAIPASDTLFSFNSSLIYKYHPSIRYSVELYRDESNALGEIRVSMRTQNSTLILAMIEFYRLWTKIEKAHVGDVVVRIDETGRYSREIKPRFKRGAERKLDTDTVGRMIAEYISAFDSAMKCFFANINFPNKAIADIEDIYENYFENSRQTI
ncbi:MAG: hypothetical protein SOZ62_01055 [Eubacteriales bacterium]|nr:hypothetical protein [Eubacteriales bacterium]